MILDYGGVDGPETPSRSLQGLLDRPNRTDWDDRTYSELPTTEMLVEDSLKLIHDRDNGRYELYDRTTRPYDGQDLWNCSSFASDGRRMAESLSETPLKNDEDCTPGESR